MGICGWSWCLGWWLVVVDAPARSRGKSERPSTDEEGTAAGRQDQLGQPDQPASVKARQTGRTAVRARRPGVLGRNSTQQPVGGRQTGRCKKAARCKVCAAAARQVKADLWAGATIDMTNRGWIAASTRGRSCPSKGTGGSRQASG